MIEHPLEPIIDEQCEVLILGSFPSVKSREISFYYGHPQNRFWKIIGTITQTDYETIEDKKKMLLEIILRYGILSTHVRLLEAVMPLLRM